MAHLDASVMVFEQKEVQGHSYDVATPNYAHLFVKQIGRVKAVQNQLLASSGCARNEVRGVVFHSKGPDIVRIHPVNIFLWRNTSHYFLFINVLWQRQLYHDSRNLWVF